MTALYAVPPWLLLALAIGVACGLACGGLMLVRRAFPRVDFSAYNDVCGIVLGVVGGLFGVTLAFIIAIVWQEYDGTRQRVAVEIAAATDLWHVARGLPPPLGTHVRRAMIDYAALMTDREWPAMRSGGESLDAEALLTRTFESVAAYRPAPNAGPNTQSQALEYLGTLHDARHHRLDDNSSGVSAFEWTVLAIGAVLVVGMCWLVGVPTLRVHLLMTGAVAAVIASMFVLVFELDYPFRGDIAVSPAGWADFAARNRASI